MTSQQLFWLFRKKLGLMVLFGFLFAAMSFVFLLVAEKNFKVKTDFLVVQKQTATQDVYTLSRSNEYIANVMEESVYSELFINEAIATGIINDSLLPTNRQDRLKAWKKMVVVSKNFQGNVLIVEAKHGNRSNALKIAQAISEVLVKKNYLFRSGAPEDVEVRVLSGPIDEKSPTLTTILLVIGNGFLFGMLLVFVTQWLKFVSQSVSREIA
jgi:capsular polysaccharide biosynthesis protein